MDRRGITAVACGVAAATACAPSAKLSVAEGTGPSPMLPAPETSLIPTVKVAPAKGWSTGERPSAAAGTVVNAFAKELDHPRWLYVLPNGDVLVSATFNPRGSRAHRSRSSICPVGRSIITGRRTSC